VTPLPSPVPPPAGFPTGTYTGVLASQGGAPGTLTLSPNGSYHIVGGTTSNGLDISGFYTVSGNGLSFQETVNQFCDYPGTYTWQISGNTLQLTKVNDLCGGGLRGRDFAEHAWIKQP
jgi:hypothetical protein